MANRMARRTVDATTKRCTHGRAGDLGRWLTSALLVLALVAPLPGMAASLATQSLDAGWEFRFAPGDRHAAEHPQAAQWLPATVPGTVQTDLMAAKLVADPYAGDNEAKIQWVGLADWQYRSTFTVDAATLARRHVELSARARRHLLRTHVERWSAPTKDGTT